MAQACPCVQVACQGPNDSNRIRTANRCVPKSLVRFLPETAQSLPPPRSAQTHVPPPIHSTVDPPHLRSQSRSPPRNVRSQPPRPTRYSASHPARQTAFSRGRKYLASILCRRRAIHRTGSRSRPVDHILPCSFPIPTSRQWHQWIPLRNCPIFRATIRRAPPTTRKLHRKRGIERAAIHARLTTGHYFSQRH
jgi:hypothetical protein